MKQFSSLAWKEWRETRVYLLIGLGIFLGLPVIGSLEQNYGSSHRFEIEATPWVLFFGGILAVFVAVGSTCRDMNDRVEDFWRSRPISVSRWLLVKYFIGLAIVLIACVLPLLVELYLNRDNYAAPFAAWYPFLWAAIYSTGFVAGVLLRRNAHAAMLGLAAMLLIYCLPVVVPPLRWLNAGSIVEIQRFSDRWPTLWSAAQIKFGAGMLAIAISLLLLSILSVRRGWQIRSGRGLMYGSISTVILILFASAAFQLGTNLPILQQADLPANESVEELHLDGLNGFVITQHIGLPSPTYCPIRYRIRSVQITPGGVTLGEARPFSKAYINRPYYASTAKNPNIIYLTQSDPIDDRVDQQESVRITNLPDNSQLTGPKLWINNPGESRPRVYALGDRLYAVGHGLVTMDISDPLKPKIISTQPISLDWGDMGDATMRKLRNYSLVLPDIPELQPRERLKLFVGVHWGCCLEDQTLCVQTDRDELIAFHLNDLTEKYASFEKIGQYDPSLLRTVFGGEKFNNLCMKNGLLYVSQGYGGGPINRSVSIFDTRGPHPMRLVGHFAAPDASVVYPLADGRSLIGGKKLWLVGPPPDRQR